MDPNWLLTAVSAIAAGIALVAAGSARKSAKAADDLVNVEREKLRRAAEPTFRAEYTQGKRKINFTMVTGPIGTCQVSGSIVTDAGHYVMVESPFVLGHMQIGDTLQLDATPIEGRGKGRFQQEFLLEVVWPGNAMKIPVHCLIPAESGAYLRAPGERG